MEKEGFVSFMKQNIMSPDNSIGGVNQLGWLWEKLSGTPLEDSHQYGEVKENILLGGIESNESHGVLFPIKRAVTRCLCEYL